MWKAAQKIVPLRSWVSESLHQKCWKEQQKAAAEQEYLLSKQQRDELFSRIVREGRDDEVDPRMRPLFLEIKEQVEREDQEQSDHYEAAEMFARLSINN